MFKAIVRGEMDMEYKSNFSLVGKTFNKKLILKVFSILSKELRDLQQKDDFSG